MPGLRKPNEIHELTGAFANHPERKRARANTMKRSPHPLGNPPKAFEADEAACWAELQDIIPPGVLCRSDRWIVELASKLMARLRRGKINAAEIGRLMQAIALMGGSPADRSRVVMPDQTPDNPFKEFLN